MLSLFQIYIIIVEKSNYFLPQINTFCTSYWWDVNSWDWGTQDGEVLFLKKCLLNSLCVRYTLLLWIKRAYFLPQISTYCTSYWWDGSSWDWGTQDGEVGGLVRVPPISASALTAGEMYLHVIRCTDEIIPPKLKQYFLLLFLQICEFQYT